MKKIANWAVLFMVVGTIGFFVWYYSNIQREAQKKFISYNSHSTSSSLANNKNKPSSVMNGREEDAQQPDIERGVKSLSNYDYDLFSTSQMKSDQEYDNYYRWLITQNPTDLLKDWQTALTSQDSKSINTANFNMAYRLQYGAGEAVYETAADLLKGDNLTADQKYLVIRLMEQASTPNALQVLLDELLLHTKQSQTYDDLLNTINDFSNLDWYVGEDGAFDESAFNARKEFIPLLEEAWFQTDESDYRQLSVLASAIAKTGTPEGVSFLLEEIRKGENNINQNGSALAAFSAMDRILSFQTTDVIQIFADELQHGKPDSLVVKASSEKLVDWVSIENGEALHVLIEWAKNVPDDSAAHVKNVFNTIPKRFLNEASIKKESFHSRKVKKGIIDIIDSH